MTKRTKIKLSKIQNEVNDLHPLLLKLFQKMPQVVNLEYNHGNREMGADFVLSKEHEIFDNEEYIGVIAKLGKIHQNFRDIETQIEECDVPRLFLGGKRRIRLDEIWIIATENITNGAQEKIYEKYSSRKIFFIDGNQLKKLIDSYIPSFWDDLSLEVGDYLSTMRVRNKDKDRNLSLLNIGDKDFYIEQDVHKRPPADYRAKALRKKRFEKVDVFKEIKSQKIIFIEGGMGAGKSKLLRQIINHFTTPEIFTESRLLPLSIDYKDLVDKFDGDIQDFICKNTTDSLQTELKDTEYLLLIDAVDEKNLPTEEQIAVLQSIIANISKIDNARAIITSRYLESLDQTGNFDYQIYRCEMRPLSLTKTIEFIRTICTELDISNRILEDLKRSQLFQELPKSPIAAILLAKLINENTQELPSNMTELYSKYIELILGRWDMDKGLQSQKEYQALDNIIMMLSEYMHENELISISIEEAEQIFNYYLQERNLDISHDDLFNKIIHRCEIIDINFKKKRLAFKHRTFIEFFYARRQITKGDFVIDSRAFSLYWMNIYFFFVGLKKDCPKILEQLINIIPDSEFERWLKVINMGNYFLAGYTSPYNIITAGVTKTVLEAAKLYREIVTDEIDSPFARIPRMHILYLMQALMRNSYSYTFFKRSIEEAALLISEGEEDNDTKAYAIFFLNVAFIDLDKNQTFDFLLEEIEGGLPIDLAMAIKHESKNLKERTKLMKKQEKRIKLLLKTDQKLNHLVKKMYDLPVKESKN